MDVFAFVWILLSGTNLSAVDRPNFSGMYTLKSAKSEFMSSKRESRPSGAEDTRSLKVVQDAEKLEITMAEAGRETVSLFSMTSGKGVYTVPGGAAGTGRAQFKGNRLLLESIVVMKPLESGPRAAFIITERWELSPDSKTLTIHNYMVLRGGGIPGISSVYVYSRI